MFEPGHGSAAYIAGKRIANPIGQIWSAAMMLAHFGKSNTAKAIERGIEDVLASPDIGGKVTMEIVGKRLLIHWASDGV